MSVSIQQVLNLHRNQLEGLIHRHGGRKLRALYEDSRVDIERRLATYKRHGMGESFNAYHLKLVLIQVREGISSLEAALQKHLASQAPIAGGLATRHLISAVKHLEKRFTGHTPVVQIEQAAVFQGMYAKTEPSLLNKFKKSSKLYGKPVIKKIRESLSRAILSGDTVDETVDRVIATHGIFDQQRWRAERIVRTETAYAYGVVKQRAMVEMAKTGLPGLSKKLVATFDDRTGDDSKELHGQVRLVNEPFEWIVKNSKGIPTGEVVKYMQPPNRPNDREVVIPWRTSWGETELTAPLVEE